MKQLKIIEKPSENIDTTHCIINNIILSNNEFDNSISIDFNLVENDKVKFLMVYEPKNFKYDDVFNFEETSNIILELNSKIKEIFNTLNIVISKEDEKSISDILLSTINMCKKMNGKHVLDHDEWEMDASFSILGNVFNNDGYYCVEIKNHNRKVENLEDWMFNMKHKNKNTIMEAYAIYDENILTWYISNNPDNIEYEELIDYLLENFTELTVKKDKSILITLD